MSRYYRMQVEISGYQPGRIDAIKTASEKEWSFTDLYEQRDGTLTASGEESLYGGESEEEFTERLSLAIWKANGEFCQVTVDAYCLEELPYDTHCLDEDDYKRLMTSARTPQLPT